MTGRRPVPLPPDRTRARLGAETRYEGVNDSSGGRPQPQKIGPCGCRGSRGGPGRSSSAARGRLLELEIPVSPVERPQPCCRRVAQTCDRKASVLTSSVPGRAYFDDRDMPLVDVGRHLQLWPQFLRHALLGPSPNADQVGLRHRHQFRLEVDTGDTVGNIGEGVDVGRTGTQPAADADRDQPAVALLVVADLENKRRPRNPGAFVIVAGAGFEPATSGL